jgi:hypothetical protein
MKELSPELIALLNYLLPGFLATWIFYTLTAHRKKEPFERIIEAVIFTALVHGILPVVESACLHTQGKRTLSL